MAKRVKFDYNGIVAESAGAAPTGQVVWGTDRTLTDVDEIEYYRQYIRQIKLSSRLIGDINAEGQYTLPNEIKRDLVKMEKEVAEDGPVFYLAMAVYMKKTFNFAIEVEEFDEFTEASLYLNESVLDYPPVMSLRTFVAKIRIPNGENVREKIYNAFHLVKSLPNVKDTDVPSLAGKMQALSDEAGLLDEVADLGAQIYIMRTLKMLEGGGEIGQKIIDEYKKEAEELKLDLKKKGSYRKLQRVLDQKIQENGGFESLPIEKETVIKPVKEYNDAIKKLDNVKSKKNAVDSHEKDGDTAKKDASSKKSEAKSAGNKSGKSGGKKADKKASGGKKDKKKDDKKKKDAKKKSSSEMSVSTLDSLGLGKKEGDKTDAGKSTQPATTILHDDIEKPVLINAEEDDGEDDIRAFLIEQAEEQDNDKQIIEDHQIEDNHEVEVVQDEAILVSDAEVEIEIDEIEFEM